MGVNLGLLFTPNLYYISTLLFYEKQLRCSLNIIRFISRFFILILFVVSCEEESVSSSNNGTSDDTLGIENLGGDEDNISDYFYNPNSSFNAKFFFYLPSVLF